MVELLRTGLSGLLAFQRSLATVGHNIANANTPSYSRQRVELGTNPPATADGNSAKHSMFIGTGVQITGIDRIYDDFLTQQVRVHETSVNQFQTLDALTSQLGGLLGDSQSGLTPALQQFFSALQDVAATPDSLATRQVLLSQSEALAGRFQETDRQLSALRDGVNQGLQGTVNQINSLADAIAAANQDIIRTKGSTGVAPSDLLDHRDGLLADLAQQVNVQTVAQADGSVSVFVGTDQTLVLGLQASHLETTRSAVDPQMLEIRYMGKGGDISKQLNGGQLGGYLSFRDHVLDPAQDSLGLLAVGLTDTFNAQHRQGMDLDGNLGQDFFRAGSPEVLANERNAGNAALTVTVSDSGQLRGSNYEVRYDGANFSVRRLADDQVVVGGGAGPFTVDGLTITVTGGMPTAGDSFLIQPTRKGAADFAVAVTDAAAVAAAAPIRTDVSLSNQGTATISAGKVVDANDPQLLQAVDIDFVSPNSFDIVDSASGAVLAANQPFTSGAPLAFNGWEVSLSGTPAQGDRFQVRPNQGGIGDNRNALALAGLQSSSTLLGGSANYQTVYAQLVAEVGAQGSRTRSTLESQQALLEQSRQARDAVSGVNLDEEAADLLRFQQAYEATAHVIRVADSLFATLLDAVRS
jgi:flagellar hook-associated protein 1 FlgK